jgi:2-iminoacetate synthase ThiH
MAGSQTPQEVTTSKMEKVIREAGRTPARRNTHYQIILSSAVELATKKHKEHKGKN